MADFIPGILFTWLALWILYAFTTNLLYPIARIALFSLQPATASTLLLSWIILPAFTALASCFLLFAPTLRLILQDHYCVAGGCQMTTSAALLVGLPALIIGFWLIASGLTIALRYWLPAYRLARQLRFAGEQNSGYTLIPSDTAAAFTLGWLSPTVYLTRGLVNQCSQDEITCILNHEHAHKARKDNLHLLIARLFTAILPTPLVKRQFEDYRLLCEQACDQVAARAQPADEVASVLLKVSHLQSRQLPGASTTFTGGHIEQRVLAVLKEDYQPVVSPYTLLMVSLALSFVLAPALLFHLWILG